MLTATYGVYIAYIITKRYRSLFLPPFYLPLNYAGMHRCFFAFGILFFLAAYSVLEAKEKLFFAEKPHEKMPKGSCCFNLGYECFCGSWTWDPVLNKQVQEPCRSEKSKKSALDAKCPWEPRSMYANDRNFPDVGHVFCLNDTYSEEKYEDRARLLTHGGVKDVEKYLETRAVSEGVMKFSRKMFYCACHFSQDHVVPGQRDVPKTLPGVAAPATTRKLAFARIQKRTSKPDEAIPQLRGSGATPYARHLFNESETRLDLLVREQEKNAVLQKELGRRCDEIAIEQIENEILREDLDELREKYQRKLILCEMQSLVLESEKPQTNAYMQTDLLRRYNDLLCSLAAHGTNL